MIPYFEFTDVYIWNQRIALFSLLLWTGAAIGLFMARRRARQVGLDPGVVAWLVAISVLVGLPGAHVLGLVAYQPETIVRDPSKIFSSLGVLSSFGGFTTATLGVLVYCRAKRIPFFPYADVLMFGFFPCLFFLRLGCTITHDHPGRLTEFFLAVKFPGGARHDLGFYEWLLVLVWIPLLHWLGRKSDVDDPPPGSILSAMVVAYSVPRFFLDFLRADDLPQHDPRYFGLTPAQYACAVLTMLGAAFFVRLKSAGRARKFS